MKIHQAIMIVIGVVASMNAVAEPVKYDQTEYIQKLIAESDFIVDICTYEMEWFPATSDFPKARWLERAVVTGVHKGTIPIGTKLEFQHYIEGPPRLFNWHFRTVVEGKLSTFFFSKEYSNLKDGKYTIKGDAHFSFSRCKENDFADAFRRELKTNPALPPRSEQDAAPNP